MYFLWTPCGRQSIHSGLRTLAEIAEAPKNFCLRGLCFLIFTVLELKQRQEEFTILLIHLNI